MTSTTTQKGCARYIYSLLYTTSPEKRCKDNARRIIIQAGQIALDKQRLKTTKETYIRDNQSPTALGYKQKRKTQTKITVFMFRAELGIENKTNKRRKCTYKTQILQN